MEGIETLQRWMDESSRIVFFGGAGVSTESGVPDFRSPDGLYADNLGTKYPRSTESGIPDFRSVDGLYHQQYQYPPETILSRSFFDRQPEEFYRFYRSKMLCLDAKPNAAHKKLAELGGGCAAWSHKTSTACTRRLAPGGCGSSTAPSCATGVCPAGSSGRCPPWRRAPVSPAVPAEA